MICPHSLWPHSLGPYLLWRLQHGADRGAESPEREIATSGVISLCEIAQLLRPVIERSSQRRVLSGRLDDCRVRIRFVKQRLQRGFERGRVSPLLYLYLYLLWRHLLW